MKQETAQHIIWMQAKYQEMFVLILNQASLLEDKIDELITRSFFGEKEIQWDFVDIILGDMLLSQKIMKLQRTLKVLQPKIYPDFQEREVVKRFNKVRKMRNLFAHSILNTKSEYAAKRRKTEIALFNFRYNPPHAQIVLEDFEAVIQTSNEVLGELEGYCRILSGE